MSSSKIETERLGDVSLIRLNDPSTLNAVSLQMLDDLSAAFDAAFRSCRAIVLCGAGRSFCAGANLAAAANELRGDVRDVGASLETHINPLMEVIRRSPIPIVAAVQGAAAGVGCSLALAADIVVAGESAYFLQAFARIGLVPDGGSSWLLSRSIGRARAMEMMLLGDRISAAKALEWGLINRLVPDSDVQTAGLDLAGQLAAGPTRSLSMIRQMAWAAADSTFAEALALERQNQKAAGRTADHAEGVAAFLQKRPAVFKGV